MNIVSVSANSHDWIERYKIKNWILKIIKIKNLWNKGYITDKYSNDWNLDTYYLYLGIYKISILVKVDINFELDWLTVVINRKWEKYVKQMFYISRPFINILNIPVFHH